MYLPVYLCHQDDLHYFLFDKNGEINSRSAIQTKPTVQLNVNRIWHFTKVRLILELVELSENNLAVPPPCDWADAPLLRSSICACPMLVGQTQLSWLGSWEIHIRTGKLVPPASSLTIIYTTSTMNTPDHSKSVS